VTRRSVATLLFSLFLTTGTAAWAWETRDMIGRRVNVPAGPRRVVSLAPSLTEIAFALGAGEHLVGVTDFCDFPPEARQKPRIGGIYTPSFETILSLRPDLVLATTEGNREDHIRELGNLGLPVYVVHPVDFASVLESIGRVGRLLGHDAEARELVGRMQREADGITGALAGSGRPRVLYVLWGDPLIVPGRGTLITDMIRRAGGDSVTGTEPLAYPRLSVEEALARQPERVVLAQHGVSSVADRIREWRHLTLLPAVREGRVYGIDGDLMHRPGPRLIDGLRRLARLLHPEVSW
jgi:iron complex transport system substrate-binding protein